MTIYGSYISRNKRKSDVEMSRVSGKICLIKESACGNVTSIATISRTSACLRTSRTKINNEREVETTISEIPLTEATQKIINFFISKNDNDRWERLCGLFRKYGDLNLHWS